MKFIENDELEKQFSCHNIRLGKKLMNCKTHGNNVQRWVANMKIKFFIRSEEEKTRHVQKLATNEKSIPFVQSKLVYPFCTPKWSLLC